MKALVDTATKEYNGIMRNSIVGYVSANNFHDCYELEINECCETRLMRL